MPTGWVIRDIAEVQKGVSELTQQVMRTRSQFGSIVNIYAQREDDPGEPPFDFETSKDVDARLAGMVDALFEMEREFDAIIRGAASLIPTREETTSG